MAQKRFEIVFRDKGMIGTSQVLRDRETGVCYLFHGYGNAGGLTPLLDKDGKPVIMPADDSAF